MLERLECRLLFAGFDCSVLPYGVVGSSQSDVLIVSAPTVNVVFGLAGDDNIRISGGKGLVCGGAGDDAILSGSWTDDIAYGGDGNDSLSGLWGNDLLYGDAGNDRLDGGAGNDELHGGSGNDLLFSGLGNDVLFGDEGDDTLYLQGGSDIADGGEGNDIVSLNGIFDDYNLVLGDGWTLTAKSRPGETSHLVNIESVRFRDRVVQLPQELIGTSGDDTLVGILPGKNVIRGLAGNDTISVTSGYGEIYAGDGDDYVNSGIWSNDIAYGGNGNDKIYGQWGNDKLYGEADNDYLNGGAGDDVLDGGDGNDRLFGDYGNDSLFGGPGFDNLYPQRGHNTADGGADVDNLFLPGNYADYIIDFEANGSLTVSRSSEDFFCVVVNVEFLMFDDGTLDVATKVFGERVVNPSGPTNPSGPVNPSSEMVVAQETVDSFEDISGISDAIVAIRVQNTDNDGNASGYITIGHVFKQGDLPSDSGIAVVIQQVSYDVQLDVKARYDDGSIKHALLTWNMPEVIGGGSLDAVLVRTVQPIRSPLQPSAILSGGYDLTADIAFDEGDGEWLAYASSNDRSSPLWREEFLATLYNLKNQLELRFDRPQVLPFPITIHATSIVDGKSVETISATVMVIPNGLQAALDLPSIVADKSVDRLWISGAPKGTSIPCAINLGNGTADKLVHVDVADLLRQAINRGNVSAWMMGADAIEVRVEQVVERDLTARFDIRYYADGTTRTNLIMLNETPTYSNDNRNLTYSLTVRQSGTSQFASGPINHVRNSNWSHVIESGRQTALHVIQNPEYLVATGAVPQYDLSLPVAIDNHNYAAAHEGTATFVPMGSGGVENVMTNVGERSDIGPLPDWAARYILTQDYRDFAVLLANGRVSGSIPWHFIDADTGRYLDLKDHPKVWFDGRGTSRDYGNDALPADIFDYSTGWQVDTAHQPSLSYVPYLFTGEHYFADELEAQASWSMGSLWPTKRQQSDTNDLMAMQQVRGFAWTMRTLGDAAYLLPDSSELKASVSGVINNNLQWVTENFVNGVGVFESAPRGMLAGLFDHPWNNQDSHDIYGTASVWMDDFVATALGTLVARGFGEASEILSWQANVLAGRFISQDLGFQPFNGGVYQMPTTKAFAPDATHGPTKPAEGYTFTTWQEVQDAIEAKGVEINEFDRGTVSPLAYSTKGMNAVTAMMSYAKDVDAFEAYGFLAANTYSRRHDAIFSQQPRNSIQPVLSDGTLLTLSRMRIGGTSDDVMNGSEASELLHGGDGNDQLLGLGGVDLLYGGLGNDILDGGDGDDYLFGNEGDDSLFGGNGNDVLRGGVGIDSLDGGAGDDVLYYQDDDTIVGGTGTDTLKLQNWREATIDLRSGKFSGIESIDLRNQPNLDVVVVDRLIIDARSIAQISDSGELFVRANPSDLITILGDFSQAEDRLVGDERFIHYVHADTHIYVLVGSNVNGNALVGTAPRFIPASEIINGSVTNQNRSGVVSLALSFDQPVTINSPTSLKILDSATGNSINLAGATLSGNGTNQLWWNFDSLVFPNGRYTFEVSRTDVVNNIGINLAESFAGQFHVLRGDLNGDAKVDSIDYALVGVNFSPLAGTKFRPGDANGDGLVRSDDYAWVAANFNPIGLPPALTLGAKDDSE